MQNNQTNTDNNNQKGQIMTNRTEGVNRSGAEVPDSGGHHGLNPAWRTIGAYGPFATKRLDWADRWNDSDISPEPTEGDLIWANHPDMPKPLQSDFFREAAIRIRRADAYAVHANDPSPLQAGALAELAEFGCSWSEKDEKDIPTLPDDDRAWCKECKAVISPDGSWDVSGLSLKGRRAAMSCSHDSRIGCGLPNILPNDVTPYLMPTGAQKVRYRSDQVHSPVSHGRIRSGRMGVFAWHAVNVTGAADRRASDGIEKLVSVLPGGAIRTTKGVSVLTAVDGHLSGDSHDRSQMLRVSNIGHMSELLHNGKVAKTEAEKAASLQKARDAKKAKNAGKAPKAKKAANAEKAAAGSTKRTKATNAADAAILADLMKLAEKVHTTR